LRQKNCKIDTAAEFCGRNSLENTCGTIWVTRQWCVVSTHLKMYSLFDKKAVLILMARNGYCLVVSGIACSLEFFTCGRMRQHIFGIAAGWNTWSCQLRQSPVAAKAYFPHI
jgi:hypothetical protein